MTLRESEVIPLLVEADKLGVKLGWEGRGTLTVEPAERCPPELAERLRLYKWHIQHMLKLGWVMVFSQALQETVFFCDDDDTRNCLISAGADEWSIYTRFELSILCRNNRVAPFTQAELRKLHQIKQTFGARIAKETLNEEESPK